MGPANNIGDELYPWERGRLKTPGAVIGRVGDE